ncbi:hypothetical protein HRbin36_01252 [bacterium HR36]|nr:hypothetical protein HRbin36_01252 [bacterium HR36]
MLVTVPTVWWLGIAAAVLAASSAVALLVVAWWRGWSIWAKVGQRWRSGLNGLCWLLALYVAARSVEYAWSCKGHITCDFAGQWLLGRMIGQGHGYQLYLVGPQREVLAQGYQGDDLELMYRDLLLKGMWNSREHSTLPKSEIEGPLYPPIWGLFTQLWAWLPPEPAHRVVVLIYAILGFVAAWCVKIATAGRLRTGEAALAIWLFPNCYHGLVLGQNPLLTVFLVAAGWALWSQQRLFAAGLVWGLLAYKPVFFVALFWVPLVIAAWRMAVGMALSAGMLVMATLPFLLPPIHGGLAPAAPRVPAKQNVWQRLVYWDEHAHGWRIAINRERLSEAWAVWQRWWQVGRRAADVYDRDENWVWMSRDLYALPRRPIWDWATLQAHWRFGWGHDHWPDVRDAAGNPLPTWRWERPGDTNNPGAVLIVRKDGNTLRLQQTNGERFGEYFGWRLPATLVSRLLLYFVGVTTAVVVAGLWWWRWRHLELLELGNSPSGAFLLTGSLLTCFHFMHYDLHPLVLPLATLIVACFRPGWWEWEAERTWPRLGWLLGRASAIFSVAILAALWLACYYNLALLRGPVRFPFETLVALGQWFVAGVWTALEYWPRTPGSAGVTPPGQTSEPAALPPFGETVALKVIGGWEPNSVK